MRDIMKNNTLLRINSKWKIKWQSENNPVSIDKIENNYVYFSDIIGREYVYTIDWFIDNYTRIPK
jgi:hypothetical protein